jgi:predicted DNA-binding transcriptional regulator YafY
MTEDLRARLVAAATAGEVIPVVYHRGSQPGTVREVIPPAVSDDELRAHDVAASIDKTFKLAHLELATPGTVTRAYKAAGPVEDGQMLQVAFASADGSNAAICRRSKSRIFWR